MKIALISRLAEPVLPGYNYASAVNQEVYWLTKELATRHEVTLIAQNGLGLSDVKSLLQVKASREREAFQEYKDKLKEFDAIVDFSDEKWSTTVREELGPKFVNVCHPVQGYQKAPPIRYPCFAGVSERHAMQLSRQLAIPVRVLPFGQPNGVDPSGKKLYAFDCDGTLESGTGPVKLDILKSLQERGDVVVIVSSSGACAALPFPRFVAGDRTSNLNAARAAHAECGRFIYVSDNAGDDQIALKAGFEYSSPTSFNPDDPKKRGDHLLFFGRVVKERGCHEFVSLCTKKRVPGVIAGDDIHVDQAYVQLVIEKCDGKLVKYYGAVGENVKNRLLEEAKALVIPYLNESDAYCLMTAKKALALGTPVYTIATGSTPELRCNTYTTLSDLYEANFDARGPQEIPDISIRSTALRLEALISEALSSPW